MMPNYLTSPTCWGLILFAMISTAVLTPLVMQLARKIGAVDSGGYRRVYKGEMPLLGGIAVAVPFIIICIVGYFRPTGMFRILGDEGSSLLILSLGSFIIVLTGVIDDKYGLSAKPKFLVQASVALFVCLMGHSISFIDLPYLGRITFGPIGGTVFTVLWLVGMINAFNIIDGIDGLSSGIALITSLGLAFLAGVNGRTFVVLLCISLAASLFTFLAYNFHPARIFLGDTGSMFLGFSLATIALMGQYKSQTTAMTLAPLLVLGFPIFETLISMLRRFLRGRPMFTGDQHHTHHRLLRKGFSQRQAALFLYGATILCSVSGVVLVLWRHPSKGLWLPILLFGITVSGITWVAGYFQRSSELKKQLFAALSARKHNMIRSAFTRYAILSANSEAGSLDLNDVMELSCREFRLDLLGVWDSENHELLIWRGVGATPTKQSNPDTTQELQIKACDGRELVVRYRFDGPHDKEELRDIPACLADIFSQVRLPYPEDNISYNTQDIHDDEGNLVPSSEEPSTTLSM